MSKLNLDDYERIILYKSLTDASYLTAIVDHVRPEFFKTKGIADIFEIIKNFHDIRHVLPTSTEIKTYLKDEMARNSFKKIVTSFKDIDSNLDRDELYENSEKFLKERAIYHTLLEVAEDTMKGSTDTSEALAKFEKACGINLITDMGLEIFGDVDRVVDSLLTAVETIPSKWEWLDDALNGGFLKNGRALYMFAGESNIGKSIILGNVAANIAEQGKNVLVISLEMSEAMYAQRIISNITSIPMSDLSTNIETMKQSLKSQQAAGNGGIFVKEFPPATMTPNMLKAFIKKVVDSGIKIDAVVIDYLNLLKGPNGDNSYERIKDIAEQVRAMTYMFNCPFISATQLNRTGFDTNNPGMVSVSESIGLVATSDSITSIFQSEEDRELGIIRFGKMKNRFGRKGHTQAMRIDYNTLTVTQADDIEELDADDGMDTLMGYQ